MKITLILTPDAAGGARLQEALASKRDALAKQGIHFAAGPGRKNHVRLAMAAMDPGHVDPLRAARGYASAHDQTLLAAVVRHEIDAEIAKLKPAHYVLASGQFLTSLTTESELTRLRDMLSRHSGDIRLILHLDEQARTLIRHATDQIWSGRSEGFGKEIALATEPDWAEAALRDWTPPDPALNRFPEIHAAAFWLDTDWVRATWEGVFGKGALTFRPYDAKRFDGQGMGRELAECFGLDRNPGNLAPAKPLAQASDEWLARARQMNALFDRLLTRGRVIPRLLWRRMLQDVAAPGTPPAPGSLSPVSRHFAAQNARLTAEFPALAATLTPDPPLPDWTEPALTMGFRATQYLAAFLPRIDKISQDARKADAEEAQHDPKALSEEAARLLPPLAQANYASLARGRFAPHNRLGSVNEEDPAAPYREVPRHPLSQGSSGNVIVACMKNEAPYIVEWTAYHRAIGVDGFLIYTNGCEDGTDAILGRLDAMGIVQHRSNDDWKGNSPQQAALNKALKEPLVQNADWLIHIDVDEFINIRTGNGTLADLFAATPEATNIAMTWRLFGHDGVQEFRDRPVIEQFTRCAPAWCPKPHTVWGFKTMFRNLGAYGKISCHRPTKLDEAKRAAVRWVNGSGQPMEDSLKDRGWRNGVADIGYDLVQLNHYALRSAESFLIKRQRGRALHVDRSIGLNYWIRMDWCDHRDVTIQRNLPRLGAEMERLLADADLARLHTEGVTWHRAKAAELRATPEFRDLFDQAVELKLTGMERVAYALALDMES